MFKTQSQTIVKSNKIYNCNIFQEVYNQNKKMLKINSLRKFYKNIQMDLNYKKILCAPIDCSKYIVIKQKHKNQKQFCTNKKIYIYIKNKKAQLIKNFILFAYFSSIAQFLIWWKANKNFK
ncbi:hypothetical protein IMG5_148600 [Ichthyophthirius multifiliis]|uniref:Transmembrane protein n=1 Tax=Ichthyophthirius multifiliis TaxID=5932 RepID=G0QYB6_ICHMU|nr:hypothetical protein IMG5_148600 [Ichthyophthirius multifiliis]EGR29779.1 hypothetical protein IMG5_148600 [Ichthyophthirius multifiliis]|eukprot:XP_004031015.1 hypothetical protein IMG5_148600 [Ichthyophthirius multifiliis]